MKKAFFNQENGIEWYVNLNPVEKYLKIDKIDNQIASKFENFNSEKRFPRKSIKHNPKPQLESSSSQHPPIKKSKISPFSKSAKSRNR